MHTVERDRVRLAYLEQGAGDPPMVLVHGWGCDHTHLAPQLEYFQLRPSHRRHRSARTRRQRRTPAGLHHGGVCR